MHKDYQFLLYKQEGKIGYLTINNISKMNALSVAVLEELKEAFTIIENDSSVHVIILTGQEKSFVAGADIKEIQQLSPVEGQKYAEFGSGIFRMIETSSKIVIAAINGFTFGGGLELAMACDIRIACTTAKMGLPEVGLGIIPGFSGTQRLPMHVGLAKAKELVFTGMPVGADEALRIGLVNKVSENLLEDATAMANAMLKHSSFAQSMAKKAMNETYTDQLPKGIEFEASLFALLFTTADYKEGTDAFINKRKPDFNN